MQNSEVPKGTTTVGIICSNGIILGADKRATMGFFIANKNTDKVLKVQDHLAMTIAGGVGDAQSLNRLLKAECTLYELQRKERITVKGASTLLGTVLQQSKYYPYWVQVLVGGMDGKVPKLYSVDMAGGVLTEEFVSTGSGSSVVYGVFEDNFEKGKTIEHNLHLAARALDAAMKRDAASGEGINLAIIDEKGYRKISEKEIKKLLSSCE